MADESPEVDGDDGTVTAAEGQGNIASARSWMKRDVSLHLQYGANELLELGT